MSADPLSLFLPAVGVFQDSSPAPFNTTARDARVSFVEMATNMAIEAYRLQTRCTWRELELTGAPPDWITANFQGIIPYDPTIEANLENPTSGLPGAVESAAGKLFRHTISATSYKVEDISSGVTGRPSMRAVWMTQAATFVIRTDGASPTQIYTGSETRTSTGYNPDAPSSSRLPNFAGPVAYVGSRIWIVNKDREVIVGDFLHATNFTGNDDLLSMETQSLDVTSTSFRSPVEIGPALSMHPVTTTRSGLLPVQAEVILGGQDQGMWGVLGGMPRSQWATTSMIRMVHPDVGPTGPYAAWAAADELLFRSSEGIGSLKYVTRETTQLGNPHINIGNEIKPLLDEDPQDLLFYASLHVSSRRQVMACTTGHMVDRAWRWSRGFVTASLSPGRTRIPEGLVWEGVSTLPKKMGEVMQFFELRDRGRRRWMAMIRKEDGTKSLAEWTENRTDDILADGTCVPVCWQVLTRRLMYSGEYSAVNFGNLTLSVLGIRSQVEVSVLARNSNDQPFKLITTRKITNSNWGTAGRADAEVIKLGDPLRPLCQKQWIQILVQGKGTCAIDLAIGSVNAGTSAPTVSNSEICAEGEALCQFDPYYRCED